jgi:DNA repair photolyase
LLSSAAHPDPWFGCKYNMNLYRGCQHQCIYCDSRSECYQIENFADILVKTNAIELLRSELPRKRVIGTIGFGAMSDTYMPIEKKYRLTRQALEVVRENGFGVHIVTKSNLVERDIDLLKDINKVYAAISFTITTTDDALAAKIEPGAARPSARFEAMKKLANAGIYTGVTLMPLLPYIEDTEENLDSIVKKTREAGGQYFIPGFGVTLRDRQRMYYYKKLDEVFTGLKQKYIDTFGNNYSCSLPHSKKLYQHFYEKCRTASIPTKIRIFEPIANTSQIGLL